ncbi:MAG: aspartate aminotransferase family protein [Candidatus Komeilibacteria bacterium]|nr:aspartate aminotransferase family protein [Candidatus Komeilibacteria bacterium]
MDYSQIQKEYLVPTYPNRNVTMVKGEGIYLYDEAGKEYIDCMIAIGGNNLGHCLPEIVQAISTQLNQLTTLHASLNNNTRSKAIGKLNEFLPPALQRYYFANSGTEAIEAAMKFSVVATGRTKFISVTNDYHGKTLGSLGATTSNHGKYLEPFKTLTPKFDYVEFGNLSDLEKTLSTEHAAIIMEPIQGEGGVVLPPAGYFKAVKKMCEDKGVLLVLDEIQTGLGRTGSMFAFQDQDFIPDILCLGKGLAGGLPVGLTAVSPQIAAKIGKGTQTSTYGGNPLVMSGIIATLDYINNHQILDNVRQTGQYFLTQLQSLNSPLIKEARGVGLMIGLELIEKAVPYAQKFQTEGVLCMPTNENILRFLPPLIISRDQINQLIAKIKTVLI